MAAKIRTNDEVIVITGKDKGKTGKVTAVFPKEHRVVVEGINIHKKHVKANPTINQPGEIKEISAPMDISNVAIFNPETKKADRVGFRFEDGKKVRFYKSNDKVIA